MPKKPPRAIADNEHVRLGDALESGREVRRLADDARGQIAHHDHSSRDADPELLGNACLEFGHRRDEFKPGPHRLLGVVFVSVRIAEVHHDAVPHVLGDVSAELVHGFFGASRIGGEDVPQILRVHAGGERRRPDQIGEHHRDLAPFGPFEWTRPGRSGNLRLGGEFGNRTQNSPAIPQ